jgi:predicted ATPase
MTQRYILTGGPGSGKSSVLLELERRGEYIVREAAEDVIKLEQARGVERPWEKPDFQRKILRLQIEREARIPRGIQRVFIDRGILDGLAYAKEGTDTYRDIQRAATQYTRVFLIENLGRTEQTKVRREDQAAALEVEGRLYRIYEEAGYKIIRVAAAPVETRADRILEYLQQQRQGGKRHD